MLTQCLQCLKPWDEEKGWIPEPLDRLLDGKHVYCPDCEQRLLASLRAVRSFGSWSFEEQIEFLRGEMLDGRQYDRLSLEAMLGFYRVDKDDWPLFVQALHDRLVLRLCHNCQREIKASESAPKLGAFTLHEGCHRQLEQKLHQILNQDWDLGGRLDAYLDMLGFPKEIRGEVKSELGRRRSASALRV